MAKINLDVWNVWNVKILSVGTRIHFPKFGQLLTKCRTKCAIDGCKTRIYSPFLTHDLLPRAIHLDTKIGPTCPPHPHDSAVSEASDSPFFGLETKS
jgi:hypothetical protein